MEVLDFDAQIGQIFGQIFGHSFRERRDQGPLADGDTLMHLVQQVFDLSLGRPHFDDWIQETGRANDLLHHLRGVTDFILGRCGADVDRLLRDFGKLIECQWAVVQCAGQPETMRNQHLFARAVAGVHAPDLGDHHVALVDNCQPFGREIIKQGPWAAAGGTARQMATIVFDAVAIADLLQHLDVVAGTLADALGLQQLTLALQEGGLLFEFVFNVDDCFPDLILMRDEMLGREDFHLGVVVQDLAGEGIDLADAFDLISPEADAQGVVAVGRLHLQHIPTHAEFRPLQGRVVALVKDVDQVAQDLIAAYHLAYGQLQGHLPIILWAAQAVDAGDRSDDYHIPPAEEGGGSSQTETLDLLVDLGILFNVGVAAGDIGLWLVIVVVRDEVLHHIIGKKLTELAVELRGQRFVVGDNQGRHLDRFDDLGYRVGLAATGDAEQHLVLHPRINAGGKFGKGLGLIPHRLKIADYLK